MTSRGVVEHRNSCNSHAAELRVEMKSLSTSTRCKVWRPAEKELAPSQQASPKLHDKTWVGLLMNQGPRISRVVEIIPGCVVSGARPSCPDNSPEPPGPGRIIRNMFGWSQLEKTVRSGVWLFRGALQGENLFSSLCAAGDWVRKGSYHTAWSVPCDSSCTCSCAYGRGPAVGPHTGRRCWPLLAGVWRAIAPLMKPWCAEGEVPTAANLNLYRGWKSCVGWHCDDEPLFGGRCGEAKLIVSVMFWRLRTFQMEGVSPVRMVKVTCAGLAMVTSLSWMANARTSSFIVRAPVGIWNGLTLRSVGSNNMLPPVLFLRQEWRVVCQRVRRVHQFLIRGIWVLDFWAFGFLLCVMCTCGVLVLLASLLCTRLGLLRCASCWTRPLGGGRWRHYLCNLWGEDFKIHKTVCKLFGIYVGS